jgi:hypothetical protein
MLDQLASRASAFERFADARWHRRLTVFPNQCRRRAVKPDGRRPNTSSKRWETFEHEARLALEAAEIVREKNKT